MMSPNVGSSRLFSSFNKVVFLFHIVITNRIKLLTEMLSTYSQPFGPSNTTLLPVLIVKVASFMTSRFAKVTLTDLH
jgi:hypothetical protein